MSQKITTKISKWGNGYGIRIPVALLETLKMNEGNSVVIENIDDCITVRREKKEFETMKIGEIYKGITPNMLREKNDSDYFGKPEGREVW